MKKLLFACILLLAAGNGYAQFGMGFGIGGGGFGMGMRVPLNGGGSGRMRGQTIENHVQQMRKDLELSDKQVIKVRSLLVERDRRSRGSEPMVAREYNERLQQILTPDQYNKLVDLRQQKRQQKQQTPPNNNDNKQTPPQKDDWDDVYQ